LWISPARENEDKWSIKKGERLTYKVWQSEIEDTFPSGSIIISITDRDSVSLMNIQSASGALQIYLAALHLLCVSPGPTQEELIEFCDTLYYSSKDPCWDLWELAGLEGDADIAQKENIIDLALQEFEKKHAESKILDAYPVFSASLPLFY
jgi:hypothetical protein